eukprot:360737-Chlamydomonas_euryale.AAC.8
MERMGDLGRDLPFRIPWPYVKHAKLLTYTQPQSNAPVQRALRGDATRTHAQQGLLTASASALRTELRPRSSRPRVLAIGGGGGGGGRGGRTRVWRVCGDHLAALTIMCVGVGSSQRSILETHFPHRAFGPCPSLPAIPVASSQTARAPLRPPRDTTLPPLTLQPREVQAQEKSSSRSTRAARYAGGRRKMEAPGRGLWAPGPEPPRLQAVRCVQPTACRRGGCSLRKL